MACAYLPFQDFIDFCIGYSRKHAIYHIRSPRITECANDGIIIDVFQVHKSTILTDINTKIDIDERISTISKNHITIATTTVFHEA